MERRNCDPMQRIASTELFSQDTMPYLVLQALGAKAYALGGEPALDTCRSSDTETLSAKPFWNSDFVQHHLNMMVELVYKVTAMIALEAPNGLVKVRSPCVVVPKCSNRMKNRFLVERHIAQLGPFCYPVR